MSRVRPFLLPALCVAAVALLTAAAGCSGSGEPYRIGVAVALSGEDREDGEAMRRALKLYEDELNAAGGIDGVRLELVVKDDQNDAGVAPKVARELVDRNVLAVIGHQSSGTALSATRLYAENEVPLITVASNLEVTRGCGEACGAGADWGPWVFSTNFEDGTTGESLAVHLAVAEDAKRVVLIHSDAKFPVGLRESFVPKAAEVGITIERELRFSADGSDEPEMCASAGEGCRVVRPADLEKTDIQPADAAPPDAVVIFANTENGAKLIRRLRRLGVDAPVFGADSFLKQSFITALDGETAGVHGASGFVFEMGNEESREFVRKYRRRSFEEITGKSPQELRDLVGWYRRKYPEAIYEIDRIDQQNARQLRDLVRRYRDRQVASQLVETYRRRYPGLIDDGVETAELSTTQLRQLVAEVQRQQPEAVHEERIAELPVDELRRLVSGHRTLARAIGHEQVAELPTDELRRLLSQHHRTRPEATCETEDVAAMDPGRLRVLVASYRQRYSEAIYDKEGIDQLSAGELRRLLAGYGERHAEAISEVAQVDELRSDKLRELMAEYRQRRDVRELMADHHRRDPEPIDHQIDAHQAEALRQLMATYRVTYDQIAEQRRRALGKLLAQYRAKDPEEFGERRTAKQLAELVRGYRGLGGAAVCEVERVLGMPADELRALVQQDASYARAIGAARIAELTGQELRGLVAQYRDTLTDPLPGKRAEEAGGIAALSAEELRERVAEYRRSSPEAISEVERIADLGSRELRRLVARYREQYHAMPSILGAYCHDALDLVVRAIRKKGGGRDRGEMRRHIRDTLAARDTAEKGVDGVSGRLYFDEFGATPRPVIVSMIQDDGFLPAYRQVKPVTDRRLLRQLQRPGGVPDVIEVGKQRTPYHLTHVVHTGIDFFRINDVDVAGMNFDVEFFLWFRWVGEEDLIAEIDFLNGIFGIEDKKWDLRQDLAGRVNYRAKKVKGTFLTPYDVANFPFDSQKLPIVVSHTTRDANQVMLVMDRQRLNHAPVEEIYPQEWDYVQREDDSGTYREDSTFGDPRLSGGPQHVEFSVYRTGVVIRRIQLPYVITLFTPLSIMVLVSMFVYFIPPGQFDARLTLVMTALLSIIVFHLASESSLPNVGYLMQADWYFMIGYALAFLLVIQTVWTNRYARLENLKLARRIDLCSALVLVPAAFAAYAYLTITAMR